MKSFRLMPEIVQNESVEEFIEAIHPGDKDLVFVSDGTRERFFKGKLQDAIVINYRKYGCGEPTDVMVESIAGDLKGREYDRVIAIGGGTILDVAKLFALETVSPVVDLFEKRIPAKKTRKLILVPTTCGTGSEVTNISILELTAIQSKFGLADNTLYADQAVLVSELLGGLPFRFFATSSIDALVHSVESFTSPKATSFTKMYSREAMRIILQVYQKIKAEGEDARLHYLSEMLLASTYAGIAFGNAGCGTVHAMSYPLGAECHVPHGEANYALFTAVYRYYFEKAPLGEIGELNSMLSDLLRCEPDLVYEELENLLDSILKRKSMTEYGLSEKDLDRFTDSVMEKQGRLMANSYILLKAEDVREIYQRVL